MIGLFFGSFNPIHTGHLIIAEFIRQQAKLDEVWFIVSPHNPLKKQKTLLPEADRLKLVKLAIKDNPHFKVSDVEFHLQRPSFTIHTLDALAKTNPRKKFAIIMGSDNLDILNQWKDYQTILDRYPVKVYSRNESSDAHRRNHKNITFFDAPQLIISSTLIRKMVVARKSIRYLVPDNVNRYIQLHQLYSKNS
jgi:nicotinate-nucleotide adenylyltransferase